MNCPAIKPSVLNSHVMRVYRCVVVRIEIFPDRLLKCSSGQSVFQPGGCLSKKIFHTWKSTWCGHTVHLCVCVCVRVHFGSERSWQCACQLISRLENKCVFSKWAHAKVRVFPDYLAVCGGTRLTTRPPRARKTIQKVASSSSSSLLAAFYLDNILT